MAGIEFVLGYPIALRDMIPQRTGVPIDLPREIQARSGIYVILNQYANQRTPANRYMGITGNFRTRFASRQGACFELGLEQNSLDGVYAYLGVVHYADENEQGYREPRSYDDDGTRIDLDGVGYDLEHIFIKGVQHLWPYGTVTNTRKTGFLRNSGSRPIRVRVSWQNGGTREHNELQVASGGGLQ
jgi:hypothetical protein